MSQVGTPYTRGFFNAQVPLSRRGAEAIVPVILSLIPANRIADLGCGTGSWLKQFQVSGVEEIRGFDGDYVERPLLEIAHDAFTPADLSQPLVWNKRYDLATSFEVAEHIAPECAETFVANACSLADIVVFGAACPFQGGTDHKNEQWPSYWAEIFARSGYLPVDGLRPLVWDMEVPDVYYIQNPVIYATRDAIEANPRLSAIGICHNAKLLDIIHPRFWEWCATARLYEGDSEYASVATGLRLFCRTSINAALRRLGLRARIDVPE